MLTGSRTKLLMHMNKTTTVFFDFDGVIHNTFDFHLLHINKHYDIELTAEEYKRMHDGNFYTNSIEVVKDIEWETYARAIAREQGALVVRPDIKLLLKDLAEVHNLFLVTSGFRMQIETYLKNNDILRYFTDEQYREDSLTKKEKFEYVFKTYNVTPEHSVFVTDTVGDVQEAHLVGLRSIAVTFGFHGREDFAKSYPEYIVDSWPEVAQTIKSTLCSI